MKYSDRGILIMIRSAIGIICLLLLIPASIALAADALVSVGEVTDKRTTGQFFAECEVVLKITGDAVADSLGIREVKITKAIDDTGRDLIKESNQISTFFNANEENKNTLDKKIILKNPSRKAQVITSLEGEIELLNPSKENGSLVVGEGFISNPGEPIAATDLDGQNVQIIYLTKESYEAKKKEFEIVCGVENPCCDRRNEYNGFASGPLSFVCPKHCSCHD